MCAAGSFWEPQFPGDEYDPLRPPVAASRIRAWEERHGLRLPATLAEALTVHDGGRVRGTNLQIASLDDFSILVESRWDDHFAPGHQEHAEFEGVDRGKLVLIAEQAGCGLILDSRAGPEPKAVVMYHDSGGVLRDEGIGPFDALIAGLRR